jgi:DNA polymerase-3 subunit epsilon
MTWLGRLLGRSPRPAGPDATALRETGFVALDIETTGLDPRRDAVVSLAAIPFVADRPRPGCAALVNPGRAIPPASSAIHGITDAAVRDAPPIGAVLPALVAHCDGSILVGHDVGFDLAVLDRELRAHGRAPLVGPALDTRRLAGGLHPDWGDLGLDAVAARLGIAIAGRHTAEGDALAAGDILLALLPRLVARGYRTVDEMLWFQQSAVWSRLIY